MARGIVVTISDSRSAGRRGDESGHIAAEMMGAMGVECVHREIVPDEKAVIEQRLREWAGRCELILTTGGTGIGARDVTPEAAAAVIDRALPGFGEAMRMGTFAETPLSIISRGGAGVLGKTLMVWLPGSPDAVRECLAVLRPAIRHVLKVLSREVTDCSKERMDARSGPEREAMP